MTGIEHAKTFAVSRFLNACALLVFVGASVGCAEMTLLETEKCDNCDLWNSDERKEAHQVVDGNLQKVIQATGIVFRPQEAISPEGGIVSLPKIWTLAEEFENYDQKFCQEVRFTNQQRINRGCSGILIGPDLFATAAHCIEDSVIEYTDGTIGCPGYHVAFGFQTHLGGTGPETIPKEDFYSCASVAVWDPVVLKDATDLPDFALIRLDRAVEGRQHYDKLNFSKPTNGTEVRGVGFPMGLPMKVSTGIVVDKIYTDDYIAAHHSQEWDDDLGHFEELISNRIFSQIDMFSGNSGGPLIDSTTGELVGIFSSVSEKWIKTTSGDGPTADYIKLSESERFYRFNPNEDKRCIEALDCDAADVLCQFHTSSDHLGAYRAELEALGIHE